MIKREATKDRFVKTTIQLRERMMSGVHARMLALNKEDFVDYLRDLIALDLRHQLLGTFDPVCLKQWRDEVGFPRNKTGREAIERMKKSVPPKRGRRPYGGPVKKFPGFISGERGRNYWPVLQWCRKRDRAWENEQRSVADGNTRRRFAILNPFSWF